MNILDTKWFFKLNENKNAKIRLFCFSYAGGGASTFYSWLDYLSPYIELISIQLPGRESRFDEDFITDMDSLSDIIATNILPLLDKPYAIFGHSLGAIISFELIRKLKDWNKTLPLVLIFSGRGAPSSKNKRELIYNLSDGEFINKLEAYNGLPESILNDKELLEYFLPIIRADFKLSQTYKYKDVEALNIPIVALTGLYDNTVELSDVLLWQNHTKLKFLYYVLEGDHFFIKEQKIKVINIINDEIIKYSFDMS